MSRNALPVPLWWFAAGFAGALIAARELPGYGAALLAAVAAGAGIALYCRRREYPAWLAAGIAVAAFSWLFWMWRTPWYNQERDFQPVRLKQITLRITDPRCAPELPWLGNPSQILAEWGGSQTLPGGTVALERLPVYHPEAAYGDVLQLTGTMYPARRFGQPAILVIDALNAPPRSSPGMQGLLLQLRNRMLDRLTRGLPDDRARNTLAGMLFGCTQGLESSDRTTYARVGVIHLFSVSGLHIGLLGALILGALFWCPFRWRYLLALSVAFYVAMTGWQVPAVRALVMFGVFCIARARLYRIPPLRLVGVAGCLILAWDPVQLWGLGFQFSFLVTAALIAAIPVERRWRQALDELREWRPPAVNRRFPVKWTSKVRQKLFSMFFSAAVAYVAGCAITLYYQGVFAPVSMLANLAVIPVVTLLYPVAALQLLCGWIPVFDVLLTGATAILLELLDGLIQLADQWVGANNMTTPGILTLLIFYLGLGWLLLAPKRRRLGWCGLAAALFFWGIEAWRLPPAVAVFEDAYRDFPTIAVSEPAIGRARLIGAPEFTNRWELLAWLGRQGIREIELAALPYPDREAWKYAADLACRVPVRELLVFQPSHWDQKTPWLRYSVAGLPRANDGWQMEKNGFHAAWHLQRHEIGIHLDGQTLTLTVDGRVLRKLQSMRRNRPEIWSCELE